MNFLNYLYDLSRTSSYDEDDKNFNDKINWNNIPNDVLNEQDIEKFNDLAIETFWYFAQDNESFIRSTQILHPNLIRYFIINNACNFVTINKKYYLESIGDIPVRTAISKQIKFGYDLSVMLRHRKNKLKKKKLPNPFNKLFDKNDNLLMRCEHIGNNRFGRGTEFRIDYTLKLKTVEGKNYFLGIEYLEENAHKNEGQDLINIQEFRWNKITVSNLNVKHICFAWESLWEKNDGYKEYYIEKLESLFTIYDSANNREEFGIQFLQKFLHDREISGRLLEAYSNKSDHVLSYNNLLKKFNIIKSDDIYNRFIQACDRYYIVENGDNDDITDTEDIFSIESDSDILYNTELKNPKYYINIHNDLLINAKGLKILTELVQESDFERLNYYITVKNIYDNIAEAAIYAINKMYDLTADITFGDIYKSFGLSHRENMPNYKKKQIKN